MEKLLKIIKPLFFRFVFPGICWGIFGYVGIIFLVKPECRDAKIYEVARATGYGFAIGFGLFWGILMNEWKRK